MLHATIRGSSANVGDPRATRFAALQIRRRNAVSLKSIPSARMNGDERRKRASFFRCGSPKDDGSQTGEGQAVPTILERTNSLRNAVSSDQAKSLPVLAPEGGGPSRPSDGETFTQYQPGLRSGEAVVRFCHLLQLQPKSSRCSDLCGEPSGPGRQFVLGNLRTHGRSRFNYRSTEPRLHAVAS